MHVFVCHCVCLVQSCQCIMFQGQGAWVSVCQGQGAMSFKCILFAGLFYFHLPLCRNAVDVGLSDYGHSIRIFQVQYQCWRAWSKANKDSSMFVDENLMEDKYFSSSFVKPQTQHALWQTLDSIMDPSQQQQRRRGQLQTNWLHSDWCKTQMESASKFNSMVCGQCPSRV